MPPTNQEQALVDLQDSLATLTYVLTGYLRELDETEHLSHGVLGFLRFAWCEVFGHAEPYKRTLMCSRCGL